LVFELRAVQRDARCRVDRAGLASDRHGDDPAGACSGASGRFSRSSSRSSRAAASTCTSARV